MGATPPPSRRSGAWECVQKVRSETRPGVILVTPYVVGGGSVRI